MKRYRRLLSKHINFKCLCGVLLSALIGPFAFCQQTTAPILTKDILNHEEAMERLLNIADFHYKVGHEGLISGDLSMAHEHLKQSTHSYQALSDLDKGSPKLLNKLASSQMKLGSVLRRKEMYELSRSSYKKGLAIFQSLAEGSHPGSRYRSAIAISYFHLGKTFWNEEDFSSSKNHFKKSLEIQQEIANRNPEDLWLQEDLGIHILWLANSELKLDNLELAKALYHSVLEQSQTVLDAKQRNLRAHKNLVLAYEGLGDYHFKMTDIASAGQYYKMALTQIEELKDSRTISQDSWQPMSTRIEYSMQEVAGIGPVSGLENRSSALSSHSNRK